MTDFTSLIQMLSTLVLTFVTWQYVKLTRQLVHKNIDPRVDLEIPEDILENKKLRAFIINRSTCDIEQINLTASALFITKDGEISNLRSCLGAQEIDGKIKPNKTAEIKFKSFFEFGSLAKAKDDLPESLSLLENYIAIEFSYHRSADRKLFAHQEIYMARIKDNKILIGKAGPRSDIDSLEKIIVQRVG